MADELRGINRLIERWSFTNETDRLSAGQYFWQDIGKVGYQQDTQQYWRLVSPTPTWQQLGQPETVVADGIGELVFNDTDGDLVFVG